MRKSKQKTTAGKAAGKSEGKNKGGRPSMRALYETTHGAAYITSLFREDLTENEVAKKLHISRSTFDKWLKESRESDNPIFAMAVDLGKRTTDTLVENKLFAAAMKGNVTACIFWLKNRKPQVWRDRVTDYEEQQLRNKKLRAEIDALMEQSAKERTETVTIIDDLGGEKLKEAADNGDKVE